MLAWDEVETLNQKWSPGGVVFGARIVSTEKVGKKSTEEVAKKPLYHRWAVMVASLAKQLRVPQGTAGDLLRAQSLLYPLLVVCSSVQLCRARR
jgi:hypothetical protein